MLAAHMGMAQALGEGPGRGQTGPGLAGEGHGLDGAPSSLGCAGSGMTDLCRFSWVRVEGAPSKLGVMLPRISWDWLGFSMVSDRLSGAKNHNMWGNILRKIAKYWGDMLLSCFRTRNDYSFFSCFGKKRTKRSRLKGRFEQMRPLKYPPPLFWWCSGILQSQLRNECERKGLSAIPAETSVYWSSE